MWSAARAVTARAAAPAAAAQLGAAGVGAADAELPVKRGRRGKADGASAAVPEPPAAGTAAAGAAAPGAVRARREDVGSRKEELAQPSAGGVRLAAASPPVEHAPAGTRLAAGAAKSEAAMLAPVAVHKAGSGAAAETADYPKPPRVPVLQRLGVTPAASAQPAGTVVAAVRDADELLQPCLVPANAVCACLECGSLQRGASNPFHASDGAVGPICV